MVQLLGKNIGRYRGHSLVLNQISKATALEVSPKPSHLHGEFPEYTMEIPEQLRCLFTATLEEQNETYRIEIPDTELEKGPVQASETYRVAILSTSKTSDSSTSKPTPEPVQDAHERPGPPVEEDDQRTVEIETIGDQGDGITRVERGFVVIVPDTTKGERVTIEITDVGDTVAFAEVTERIDSR
mgnify:CR=1 FL=1